MAIVEDGGAGGAEGGGGAGGAVSALAEAARLAGAVALARGLAQAALRSAEAVEPVPVKAVVQRPAVPGVFKSKRR